MPTTYTLISANTLTGDTTTVTFSAIPSTYTDLVLRFSARTDETGNTYSLLNLRINSTTVNYSNIELQGSGSAATSTTNSAATSVRLRYIDSDSATTSTFGSGEIYIPSYLASQNKPFSASLAQETNATAAYISAVANLWRDTTAISSISLYNTSGYNLKTGSSFYLYGIKNS